MLFHGIHLSVNPINLLMIYSWLNLPSIMLWSIFIVDILGIIYSLESLNLLKYKMLTYFNLNQSIFLKKYDQQREWMLVSSPNWGLKDCSTVKGRKQNQKLDKFHMSF